MKKCPYCAEDIQDDAIKCRYCMEFLDRPPSVPPPLKSPEAWYFRKGTIVTAVLCAGPLALPLIWWRPRTTISVKAGLTAAILAFTWVLTIICIQSIKTLITYYEFMNTDF